jgi:hypothetical protein
MVKPNADTKALMIATCFAGVLSSPEAWRDYEHEAGNRAFDGKAQPSETFEEWAIRRAENAAKRIWGRATQ